MHLCIDASPISNSTVSIAALYLSYDNEKLYSMLFIRWCGIEHTNSKWIWHYFCCFRLLFDQVHGHNGHIFWAQLNLNNYIDFDKSPLLSNFKQCELFFNISNICEDYVIYRSLNKLIINLLPYRSNCFAFNRFEICT